MQVTFKAAVTVQPQKKFRSSVVIIQLLLSARIMEIIRSILLPFLALALPGQYMYPVAAHRPAEEAGLLNMQRFRSGFIQEEEDIPPSPASIMEANAAHLPGDLTGTSHSVRVDEFEIGYEASYEIQAAPNTGRVTLDLIDDANENIVLHVDARYNWLGEKNVLVLNAWRDGQWGPEQRPTGFDFTPGKRSLVTAVAKQNGFHILQNGCEIALFAYRPGLTFASVSRIRVRSEANEAADDASLTVDFD